MNASFSLISRLMESSSIHFAVAQGLHGMWVLYAKAVAGTLLLAVAGLGGGHWMRKLLPKGISMLDSFALESLGGIGLLSMALFLVGQVAFHRALIFAIVLLCSLLGLPACVDLVRKFFSQQFRNSGPPLGAGLVLVLVLLLTAIAGLAQIVGDWGQDGVAYHLLEAKVWLREGAVRPVLDTVNSAYPATNEILFGAAMAVGGERAPGFFAVLALTLFFLVVWSLAKRAGLDSNGAWWAAALAAAMGAVYIGAHSGFIDVFFTAMVLAAVRVGLDARLPRHFVAFGIFCGLTMATKYTALFIFPMLLICSGISTGAFAASARKAFFRDSLVCIVVAGVLASPYYVRNWIYFGFPIFPPPLFAANWTKPGYFSPRALANYYALFYRHGPGMGKSIKALLLLPFNLTFHTANFNGAGGIGLSGLALAPFGFYASRRSSVCCALAVLIVLLTVVWFPSFQEARYLMPAFPILCIFAVIGWNYAKSTSRRTSRILSAAVVLISILYGLALMASSRVEDLRAALSPGFAAQRRETEIPFSASFSYLNRSLDVRKVLILDPSVPAYFLDKSYLKPFGQWGELTLPGVTNPAEAVAAARANLVTHILDVESEVAGFQINQPVHGLRLVFEGKGQRVYLLEPEK